MCNSTVEYSKCSYMSIYDMSKGSKHIELCIIYKLRVKMPICLKLEYSPFLANFYASCPFQCIAPEMTLFHRFNSQKVWKSGHDNCFYSEWLVSHSSIWFQFTSLFWPFFSTFRCLRSTLIRNPDSELSSFTLMVVYHFLPNASAMNLHILLI